MIYLELFWAFFQIGLFTFGGGYAMIPLIEEEVLANGWLANSTLSLVDFIAISESTPGPFAINIATFIGMNEASFLGAFIATLGVVTPSFVIILLIAKFFVRFSSHQAVQAVMTGIRPVVVGILLSIMLSFSVRAIFQSELIGFDWTGFDYRALIIFVVILGFTRFVKKISPVLAILFSAALGILLYGLL